MDSESSYEDGSEIGGEDSSANEDGKGEHLHDLDGGTLDNSLQSKCPDKWRKVKESKGERQERLQKHYNDRYLSLLNEASTDGTDVTESDFGSTRIGVTDWSSSEKERFFIALSRRSKADVRGIAASIGSKSELQVYEYLLLLEEEDRSRRLYALQPSTVSHAEIPAAAEVSTECEASLEQAADALASYQDKFDRAVGEQMHDGPWLIDHVAAKAHDMLVDHGCDSSAPEESTWKGSPMPAGQLFRLSSWLSLTERFFMNSDPSKNENNWNTHSAQDEVPSLTQGAISDLYDLTLHHLRKLIQTSAFCAESRIRNTKDHGYTAKAFVKEQDVAAAIDVLGLQDDASHFWIKLARRNGLKVVEDDGKKDRRYAKVLDYAEVERILREAAARRRGRRSVSVISGIMSSGEGSDHILETKFIGDMEVEVILTSDESVDHDDFNASPQLGNPGETIPVLSQTKRRIHDAESSLASTDEEGLSISGDDQDDHLELLDHINSRHQERQLYHDLGWAAPDTQLEQLDDEESRKQVLQNLQHKVGTELHDWRESIPSYVENWEEHRYSLEKTWFGENQRQDKRRKVVHNAGEPQDLPFRAPRM